MTINQLCRIHQASPFRPFTIDLADGRQFHIRHPEFLSQSPSGRTVIVYDDEDAFSVLDLLLVTELEAHPAEPETAESG